MKGYDLVIYSRACYVDKMAMMRKEHDLAALGESCQRPQDVCRPRIIRSNEDIIKHERHLRV